MSHKKNKGQISTEMLVMVVIVLLIFVVVIVNNSLMNDTSLIVANAYSEKSECLHLSYAMSQVYSAGEGSQTFFSLKKDVEIIGPNKVIKINQTMCSFLANSPNANLSAGDFILKNVDNNILFFGA